MTDKAPAMRGDAPRLVGADHVPNPVAAYFECLDGEDFERLATLWTADAQLRAVGARPRRGRDDVMSYFHPLFAPWAAHRDRPTRVMVAGDSATVEVEFTGTTRDGREITFEAVDVFDFADTKIVNLTCWYDLVWLRKQL